MEKRRLFVHTEANLCETEAKHEFLLHIEATNPVSVAPLPPPVHLISLRYPFVLASINGAITGTRLLCRLRMGLSTVAWLIL